MFFSNKLVLCAFAISGVPSANGTRHGVSENLRQRNLLAWGYRRIFLVSFAD